MKYTYLYFCHVFPKAVPLGGNQSLDLFLLVVEKEKYEDIGEA